VTQAAARGLITRHEPPIFASAKNLGRPDGLPAL